MRILIISSFLPYPLFNGGHVRLYNLMKQLARHHKLTLVCEKRDHQTDKDIAEVKKLCEQVYCVDRKKQWSMSNIAKSGISPNPFLLIGHTLPEMKQRIISLLREKTFDLIHVETSYVFQNLPKTYLPIVLAEHNIEYQVYRKYVDVAPMPLRPLLMLDIEKLKYWEKEFWKKATKLVAVSDADKAEMGREDTVVVPNGVGKNSFPFVSYKKKFARKEKRILFMGDFKWLQNREAVNYILDKIWPEIEKKTQAKGLRMNIKLWIVGKHIPDDIKSQKSDSILIDENAPDDTAKIYEKSFALLAPITVGGGTSYKILESMASGVVVVTTALGVKGLEAVPGKHALVGKTVEDFTSQIISLLDGETQYEKIQKEARILIEEKYTWEEIAKKLEHVYTQAIAI